MQSDQLQALNIAIVGAGIGGLATALSLHQIGCHAKIFESARSLQSVGVGIHLMPNGVRELDELGLLPQLEAQSIATRDIRYLNRFGQQIWLNLRGRYAGYRWPQLAIHRGCLQQILLTAVQQRLGSPQLVRGVRVQRYRLEQEGVLLDCEERESGQIEQRGPFDLVVACDGIHSALRKQMVQHADEPRFKGSVMWRGVSLSDAVLQNDSMFLVGEPDCKFICYPIATYADEKPPSGKIFLNWIADIRLANDPLQRRRDWFQRGDIQEVLPHFVDWKAPDLDINQTIRNHLDCFVFPKVDKDPLDNWIDGPVALLGDAAHPTYPSGSQGASQAILDSRYLAAALQQCASVDQALGQYQAKRLPTTTQLVEANRAARQEQLLQTVAERAPHGFNDIREVLAADEFDEVFARFKKIAGHDIDTLNQRESIVSMQPQG